MQLAREAGGNPMDGMMLSMMYGAVIIRVLDALADHLQEKFPGEVITLPNMTTLDAYLRGLAAAGRK